MPANLREQHVALFNYASSMEEPGAGKTTFDLTPYIALLPGGSSKESLDFILTTLAPDDDPSEAGVAMLGQPLDLQRHVIMPGKQQIVTGLPTDFEADWKTLADPSAEFETACEIIRKHAWAVPGTRGEPGVSRYEEFKLLSALVHASFGNPEPSPEFTLIGGDFPGIQRAIYTITSKGAAKSLRGRSLYLQLLGDGVVRRILQEWDLPWANVVYAAGGNFVILAPPGVEAAVTTMTKEINTELIKAFQGDISLCIVPHPLPAQAIGNSRLFEQSYSALKSLLGAAKQRPFENVDYQALFDEQGGQTAEHCAVCHYDPDGVSELRERKVSDGQRVELWCDECIGFANLAEMFAKNNRYLTVNTTPSQGDLWQDRLFAITKYWYSLHRELPKDTSFIYSLNTTTFRESGAHGFRFLATHTPLDEDGSLREFSSLAADSSSSGFKRIGILRMDVDGLGAIFQDYLKPLSLTRISAASSAVSLFFEGWLNRICDQIEQDNQRPDSLYLIYAGGDDLFIVGPWDLMPILADQVRQELALYVNHNPYITISAGIDVEDEKYPLYRAAERARSALDEQAKGEWTGIDGKDYQKNAICLFGQVVGWKSDWQVVVRERDRLLSLLGAKMPKALVQTILQLHSQYAEGRRQLAKENHRQGKPPPRLYYGRWMWMKVYSLTRMAQQYEKHNLMDHDEQPVDVRQQLKELQDRILKPEQIHLAGLAARWVDYLTRESKNS